MRVKTHFQCGNDVQQFAERALARPELLKTHLLQVCETECRELAHVKLMLLDRTCEGWPLGQ